MSEQQSKKRGKRSDAQKQARAREGYEPLPPSQPVAGAFGEQQGAHQTDRIWLSTLMRRLVAENKLQNPTE